MNTPASVDNKTKALQTRWSEDERKQRASYLADRRHLAPFLVPHRFEGEAAPQDLKRAQFGFGIGLNRAYVSDILGHIRSADTSTETASVATPDADRFQRDATGDGSTLEQFIQDTILPWMLTSLGGYIVVDSPGADSQVSDGSEVGAETRAAQNQKNLRPVATWVPMSAVRARGMKRGRLSWIKVEEEVDLRDPKTNTGNVEIWTLLYSLTDVGLTEIQRYNQKDEPQGPPVVFGKFVDTFGNAILPMVYAGFGQHPDIEALGCGLLYGLDDIVIDAWNIWSETREAYRDSAFGMWSYSGNNFDEVQEQMSSGSRLVNLGDKDEGEPKLERIAADPGEVESGLRMLEQAVKSWALGARRRSEEAMERTGVRSGVSIKAEFNLDQRPLLIEIAGALDEVETNLWRVVAQVLSKTVRDLEKIQVVRDTDFRQENEEERIARIVSEFVETQLSIPEDAAVTLTMKWLESTGYFDFQGENGEALRTSLEAQVRELAAAKQQRQANDLGLGAAFPGL